MKVFLHRTTSSFGISIGTSLALESLFGVDTKVYDKDRIIEPISISSYSKYYINVYTLVRNIYGALQTEDLNKIIFENSHKQELIETFLGEVELINQLFDNSSCELWYFIPNYSNVTNRKFIKANKKVTKKDQIHINTISIVKRLSDELNKLNVNIIEDTYKLPATDEKVLITTHITPDLLNIKYIRNLDLLEAYTGVLKKKISFNSKYPKSKVIDTSRLPFNELLLRLLGDGYLLPNPMVNLRKNINEISRVKLWTPLTTRDKVIADLKSDPDVKEQVNVILKYDTSYR